jgi:hypothetical protein
MTIADAVEIASAWLNRPNVVVLSPGARYWQILQNLLVEGQVAGSLVTMHTLRRWLSNVGRPLPLPIAGFARFPGLRLLNPLQ